VPLYEYYCESCDRVFEALRPIRESDQPAPCPACGHEADRIMPTTFAAMSHTGGWKQRVPFHHGPVRTGETKPPVARVTPKGGAGRKQKKETEAE
jgi:putative FmdB family regulatory protein